MYEKIYINKTKKNPFVNSHRKRTVGSVYNERYYALRLFRMNFNYNDQRILSKILDGDGLRDVLLLNDPKTNFKKKRYLD